MVVDVVVSWLVDVVVSWLVVLFVCCFVCYGLRGCCKLLCLPLLLDFFLGLYLSCDTAILPLDTAKVRLTESVFTFFDRYQRVTFFLYPVIHELCHICFCSSA